MTANWPINSVMSVCLSVCRLVGGSACLAVQQQHIPPQQHTHPCAQYFSLITHRSLTHPCQMPAYIKVGRRCLSPSSVYSVSLSVFMFLSKSKFRLLYCLNHKPLKSRYYWVLDFTHNDKDTLITAQLFHLEPQMV